MFSYIHELYPCTRIFFSNCIRTIAEPLKMGGSIFPQPWSNVVQCPAS